MFEKGQKVRNWWLVRKWGYGVSTTPTGRDAWSIAPPAGLDHTGTLNQVREAIRNDRDYAAWRSGGTFTHARWFFDGRPVRWVMDEHGVRYNVKEFLSEIDFRDAAGHDRPEEITVIFHE